MSTKYYDIEAQIQVLACVINDSSLLEESGKYFYDPDDFVNDYHKVIFGAAFNQYQMGATRLTVNDIESYIEKRPEWYGIYKTYGGREKLNTFIEKVDRQNFDAYYNRVKKLSLLRGYEKCGLDMSFIYNPDELDARKKKLQEDAFDALSLNEIADKIEERISFIRSKYVDNSTDEATQAGQGIFDLLESLKDSPDVGVDLYGKYINTVTRGARLGKFYIRSAPTGVGKTRTMIADAATIAYNRLYRNGEWIDNDISHPTLFISTEMELEEVQTMLLAFVADVDEDKIKTTRWDGEEYDRIMEAAKIISSQPLYVEVIPDFNLKDIENCIKRSIRVHKTQHIFFDYVHTSMKILEEITRRSGGVKLREDNILFLLSVKLKDLCTQFNVFILTATQLNQDWKTDTIPDQNLLRGAKAIADKCDFGSILLNVTDEDIDNLQTIVSQGGYQMPNMKLSVYKNRGGKYTNMYLWIFANKGTCKYDPIFATDYQYNHIRITDSTARCAF